MVGFYFNAKVLRRLICSGGEKQMGLKVLYSCRAETSTYITLTIYPENDMSYSVLQLNNIPPPASHSPPQHLSRFQAPFIRPGSSWALLRPPQSLMSSRGGAAIPGGEKWKYFQTRSPSQSKCCKWTKEPSNWQFLGWERTYFKGEISFLLLLRFASFSLTFSHSLQWHLLVAMVTMVPEVMG